MALLGIHSVGSIVYIEAKLQYHRIWKRVKFFGVTLEI